MPKKRRHSTVLNSTPPLANLELFPDELKELRDSLGSRYSYKGRIKEGKTGATYRLALASNHNVYVCLKTIRPSIEDEATRELVRLTLKKEIEILEPLSHRSLPTVFEYDFRADVPYYVATFHPGHTFSDFKRQGKVLPLRDAIFVIASLLDVLKYMHAKDREHCDLHLNNILIGDDVHREGILVIDFGSGHRGSSTSPDTPNNGRVDFKPPDLQRADRQIVNRVEARLDFVRADLHALGDLLLQMEDSFLAHASAAVRAEYRQFSIDLKGGGLIDWKAIEDRFDLVVDPYRNLGRNADLFLSTDAASNSITIPVTGSVPVGPPALAVINTTQFQRLRYLKQLSFCDWTFPGATHSRFEHSLGVFAQAKMAIETLCHQPQFRSAFSPIMVRGFLLASLVHDIGHYPFAHAIEQYARARFPDNNDALSAAKHETYSLWLLENDPELVETIDRHWGNEALQHAKHLLRPGEPRGLGLLLDGPLDVDKLDYLPRDAKHCGITFGDGLDTRKLLSALRYVATPEGFRVSLKGIPSAEGFFVLQDQMLGNVYWHEIVRSVFAMFHAILEVCVGDDPVVFRQFVNGLQKSKGEADSIRSVIHKRLEEIKVAVLPAPVRKRVYHTVDLLQHPQYASVYQPIAIYRESDNPMPPKPHTIFETLFKNEPSAVGDPKRVRWDNVRRLKNAFLEALKSQGIEATTFDVAIDVPFGKSSMRHIDWYDDAERCDRKFESLTHVGKSFFDKPAAHWSPVRVYANPELTKQLPPEALAAVRDLAHANFF